jgi:hypothetical protein
MGKDLRGCATGSSEGKWVVDGEWSVVSSGDLGIV